MTAGLPDRGRVIGLDLGSRRIGVAVSDGDRRLATPLEVIPRGSSREADHRRVQHLVDEYEATGVVVGLPRNLGGAVGPAALLVLEEVAELADRISVPVDTVDERMTTVVAHRQMAAAGRQSRHRRQVVDQVAASGILESWLEQHRNRGATR